MRLCTSCGATLNAGVLICPGCGTAQAPSGPVARTGQTDSMIGRNVMAQYHIMQKIGDGSLGSVYIADQSNVSRRAAIKILNKQMSLDPTVASRFQDEATLVSRLRHPHLVEVYDYGAMSDGTLFLAMEFVEGWSLSRELSQMRSLPVARALDIAAQCCEAVAEAHRGGVIHGDLKPANVHLVKSATGKDFVKIADFGIAKLQPTKAPQYVAPEVLMGAPAGPQADVYSLAAVVYEMITGRPPLQAADAHTMAQMHTTQFPPTMTQAAPNANVPPSVDQIVMQALAKEPHSRPNGAVALGNALRAAKTSVAKAAGGGGTGLMIGAAVVAVLGLGGLGLAVVVLAADGDESSEVGENDSGSKGKGKDKGKDKSEDDGGDEGEKKKPEIDPALLAQLSPESRALLEKDVAGLEKELFDLLDQYPPSTARQIREQYVLQAASPPGGLDPEGYRKYLLVQWVSAYKQGLKNMPTDDRSTPELEKAYLALESQLPVETRQAQIKSLKENLGDGDDAEWNYRMSLIALIKNQEQANQ